MEKEKKHYFVDLFAGCGGMSLGLEKAGFIPLLFSELNESAANSYKVNRDEYCFVPLKDAGKPFNGHGKKVRPVVVQVGDVKELTDYRLKQLNGKWKKSRTPVDLVCGGPPCQGFSKIGHRRSETALNNNKHKIPSNFLFKEMVRVIRCLNPKVFVFENVQGIQTSFWEIRKEPSRIIKDVLGEFNRLKGYRVELKLVKCSEHGVPQRRPRVLIVGIQDKIGKGLSKDEFFPPVTEDPFLNLKDVIGDLIDGRTRGRYIARKKRDKKERKYPKGTRLSNKKKRLFRATKKHWMKNSDKELLDQFTEHYYTKHSKKVVKKFKVLQRYDGHIPDRHKAMRTKKFSQRLLRGEWLNGGPSITVTSLPDDLVHYKEPRILTVREWARLQTFPDWYCFCGPRTTGGRLRAGEPSKGNWYREVPRYTQIGNAVPVELAYSLGKTFLKILKKGSNSCKSR